LLVYSKHPRGVFIGLGTVYMEQVHQQIQPNKASREVIESCKGKLPDVKIQYSKIVYPKEYANTVQPVTAQHLTNSTANYHSQKEGYLRI
jgi:hypothetical protein